MQEASVQRFGGILFFFITRPRSRLLFVNISVFGVVDCPLGHAPNIKYFLGMDRFLPCRQLRKAPASGIPRGRGFLPCRQLRKVRMRVRPLPSGFLPCRQLRKQRPGFRVGDDGFLPCRQLRKVNNAEANRVVWFLPCRQLRKGS